MKRIIVLALLMLTAFAVPAYAQEENVTPAATATPIPNSVNYKLAFPGILPTSPFYKLKVLRDKIHEFLLQDPIAKVNFYLLQTDKGILASAILVEQNKVSLANETVLKAENNMTLIISEFNTIARRPNQEMFDRLLLASKKHEEVVSGTMSKLPENQKSTFAATLNFIKTNEDNLRQVFANKTLSFL